MSKIDFISLIKAANIGINPHATIEANRLEKDVPTTRMVAKVVPTKDVPTTRMVAKVVPTKDVPTTRMVAKVVPMKDVPTTRMVAKVVPTKDVPTNSYRPVNQAPMLNVGTTKNVGTIKKEFVSTEHISTSYLETNKVIITKLEIDNTLNEDLLNSLDKEDKINYLARRGWKISCEVRKNQLYDYAVKYINREKKRLYLGKTEIG